MSGAVIATTLKNAEHVLDSFIAYHLAIGFEHIFLFFDDPADPGLRRAAAYPRVTAIAHDAALRERWRALPQYGEQAPFVDREVMARQVLNVELAMRLAREGGFDSWPKLVADFHERDFTAFHLNGDILCGAFTIDRGEDIMVTRELLGRRVDAALLADEDFDLWDLVDTEEAMR